MMELTGIEWFRFILTSLIGGSILAGTIISWFLFKVERVHGLEDVK